MSLLRFTVTTATDKPAAVAEAATTTPVLTPALATLATPVRTANPAQARTSAAAARASTTTV